MYCYVSKSCFCLLSDQLKRRGKEIDVVDFLKNMKVFSSETAEDIESILKIVKNFPKYLGLSGFNGFDAARCVKWLALISRVQNANGYIKQPSNLLKADISSTEFLYAKRMGEYAMRISNASKFDANHHESDPHISDFGNHSHDELNSAMGLTDDNTILFSWFQEEENERGKSMVCIINFILGHLIFFHYTACTVNDALGL